MKKTLPLTLSAAIIILASAFNANAQVASNPPYTLEQSVFAAGGRSTGTDTATGNTFTLDGAIGQAAGNTSRGDGFALTGGFFTAAAPILPTAATALISGQAIANDGRPLSGVTLTLIGSAPGSSRTVITDRQGSFAFYDLELNGIYLISATRKGYSFASSATATASQAITLFGDLPGVTFVGTPRGRTFRGRARQ